MRLLFVMLFIVGICCTAAGAQDAVLLQDREALCPIVPEPLVSKIAAEVKGKGQCSVACSGCGCKGGPGYRHGGDCVAWKDLVKKCGAAPHAGCTRECTPVKQGCLGRAWIIPLAAALGLAIQFQRADAPASSAASQENEKADQRSAEQQVRKR